MVSFDGMSSKECVELIKKIEDDFEYHKEKTDLKKLSELYNGLKGKLVNFAKDGDCISFAKLVFDIQLADHQVEWIELALKSRRLCLMASRDHGKSKSYSEVLPLMKIAMDPNIRILLVSKTFALAKKSLRVIKAILENNEGFDSVFGNRYSGKEYWTESHIYCKRSMILKDPTVEAVGCTQAITGNRAELLICDDIIDDIMAVSEIQRKRTLDWFFGTLLELLEPDGQCIVIGTRKHYLDLYSYLLEKNATFDTRIYKAIEIKNIDDIEYTPIYEQKKQKKIIVDVDIKEGNDYKVLWPEKWPLNRLLVKKEETGSALFSREQQNEVIDDETALFKIKHLIQCRDFEVSYIREGTDQYPHEIIGTKYKFKLQTWDVAAVDSKNKAERTDSDYTVGYTIGVTHSGERHILNCYRQRGLSYTQYCKDIKYQHDLYIPDVVIIEANLFQNIYIQNLMMETDMPIRPHITTASRNDMYTGIPRMSQLFENMKYKFPYKTEYDQNMTDVLLSEFHDLGRGRHDDAVLALWFGELWIPDMNIMFDNMFAEDDRVPMVF